MNKLNTLTKQAEKILAYGINEGYVPDEGLFSNLSYYVNGIMDVACYLGASEEEAVQEVIDTQEVMLSLLNSGKSFRELVYHAEDVYRALCREAGLRP